MIRCVRPIRRAMNNRQGEMRDIPLDRLRHISRRMAEQAARARREAMAW